MVHINGSRGDISSITGSQVTEATGQEFEKLRKLVTERY